MLDDLFKKKNPIIEMLIIALAVPIAFLVILLYPFIKIKFFRLCSDRIGHYAVNTELLLCYLDAHKEKNCIYFFYLINGPICNSQLHKMWSRKIHILKFPRFFEYVTRCLQKILKNSYKNDEVRRFEKADGCRDIDGFLRTMPQQLNFNENEFRQGEEIKKKLGLPAEQKYVCLFVRDSAYLDNHYPGRDWSYHEHRDSNIENYKKTILWLAEKGYFVVRMGKVVNQRLSFQHPKVIDYANHSERSDFSDIFLTAFCDFFISTSAGLDGVAQIFRRPIVHTNVSPMHQLLQYWYPNKLFIFKKIYDEQKNKLVSFDEIEVKLSAENNPVAVMKKNNWILTENTEDEIVDVVSEMEHLCRTGEYQHNVENPFRKLVNTEIALPMLPDRDILRKSVEHMYVKPGRKFWNENVFLRNYL